MEVVCCSTEVIILFTRNVILFNLSLVYLSERKHHLALETTSFAGFCFAY